MNRLLLLKPFILFFFLFSNHESSPSSATINFLLLLLRRWSTISYGRPWTHWSNDVRVKNTEKVATVKFNAQNPFVLIRQLYPYLQAGRRYPAFWGGQEVQHEACGGRGHVT